MCCLVFQEMLEGSKVVIIKEVLNLSDKAKMDMAPYLEDVEVWYRPGKDHVNVDSLSRLV